MRSNREVTSVPLYTENHLDSIKLSSHLYINQS